jgi:hypothetical protein
LAVSADVPIRAEAVAARPHRGLHVRVGACPSPEELCAIPGVVGSWRFSGGSDDPLASRRRGGIHEPITVAWLDDADAALPGVAPDGLLAATFLPITPWAWDWFDPVG